MPTRRGLGRLLAGASLLATRPAWGQEAPSLDDTFNSEGRYLPTYLSLKAQAEAGDADARDFLRQFAALVGDEATAVGLTERPRSAAAILPDLTDATARDALDAITEAARDARIVILNEAHNVSGHRAFAARVARALRPLGFDWFAAETFTPRQPLPHADIGAYRSGMPFLASYGYYSQDPVYAETVREAAALGYRFAAYEQIWDQRVDGADALAEIAAREEAQADNLIAAVLAREPDARIFVFCGYSHALEAPDAYAAWFAARLKAKTGLDPLTIEQSANWPATRSENDASHVAAVLGRFSPDRPVVVEQGGVAFTVASYAGKVDLSVFHPRLEQVAGRPGWLAADPMRKAVRVETPRGEGVRLLQAFRADEGLAGVPADQMLLEPDQDVATLMLRPGVFILRVERETGAEAAYGRVRV